MGEKARRYNKGKNRLELIPTFAKEQLANVYTRGAHKYSIYKDKDGNELLGSKVSFEERSNYELIDDASLNWRKGLSWTETIGSVERHIEAWKKGEDFDSELSTYHLANASWGLFTLLEYYKSHPELDDRWKEPQKRIALDFDDIVCQFVPAYCKKVGIEIPNSWYLDYNFIPNIEKLHQDEDFWMNLEPLFDPSELKFEPVMYITARDPKLEEWTTKWLEKHNFPKAPVIFSRNKGITCKENNINIFVDDSPKNYDEINKEGVACFLMDTIWNRYRNVGYRRIKHVNDIM